VGVGSSLGCALHLLQPWTASESIAAATTLLLPTVALPLPHGVQICTLMAFAASIPALVRQLRSGAGIAQRKAPKPLPRITENGGEAAAEEVVAAGGVPPLVSLLSSGSDTAQLAATCTLYDVAAVSRAGRAAISAADGVAALVRLLGRSNKQSVLRKAALALAQLIQEPGAPDPVPAIVASGCIPLLLALLSHSSEEAQVGAAGAIAAMATCGSQATVDQLLAAGAAQAVVCSLLSSHDAVLLQYAATALTNLTRLKDSLQAAVDAAEAGALPVLLQLLDSSDGSQRYCNPVASALCNVCVSLDLEELPEQQEQQLAAVKAELMMAGAAAAAIRLLRRQGSTKVQHAAAAMVAFLARGDAAVSAELVAAGAVPSLMEVESEDEKLLHAFVAAMQRLADTSPEAAAALEAALASESD